MVSLSRSVLVLDRVGPMGVRCIVVNSRVLPIQTVDGSRLACRPRYSSDNVSQSGHSMLTLTHLVRARSTSRWSPPALGQHLSNTIDGTGGDLPLPIVLGDEGAGVGRSGSAPGVHDPSPGQSRHPVLGAGLREMRRVPLGLAGMGRATSPTF